MRFNCDRFKRPSRHQRITQWHRWFAWYPVRIADGDCRWLEYVERKATYWCGWDSDGYYWYYRPEVNGR